MMPPEKMGELGAAMAVSLDTALREMTADEWADRLVGSDKSTIASALAAAEARGRRKGQSDFRGAADNFEVAYRYAVNAGKSGADSADLLASAETFARIGYEELRKSI